jgi:hypothetical protein
MKKGYVAPGWSEEEIKEAIGMLIQGHTMYLFKGEYWDHRMLQHAVETELEMLYQKKRLREIEKQKMIKNAGEN